MRMQAVIFDIDGTLVQSADIDDFLYRQAVTSALGPVQFRPTLADYDYVTDSGILSQLLQDNDLTNIPDPTPIIQSNFFAALEQHASTHGPFVEFPGARNFIGALCRSDQHCVAIATGGWRASAILKLTSAGFDTDGIPIATSDREYDRSRIMRAALADLGTGFESVTYYGDGPWDREACNALGWRFVAVGSALNGIQSFSATGVAHLK